MFYLIFRSKVPYPGQYVIILGYHQPKHPNFNLQYALGTAHGVSNGKVAVKHCPATSGCRSLVTQTNGMQSFDIEDEFTFNITVSL